MHSLSCSVEITCSPSAGPLRYVQLNSGDDNKENIRGNSMLCRIQTMWNWFSTVSMWFIQCAQNATLTINVWYWWVYSTQLFDSFFSLLFCLNNRFCRLEFSYWPNEKKMSNTKAKRNEWKIESRRPLMMPWNSHFSAFFNFYFICSAESVVNTLCIYVL